MDALALAKNFLLHCTEHKLYAIMPTEPPVSEELQGAKFVAYEKDGTGVVIFRSIVHNAASPETVQPVLQAFVYLIMALTESVTVQRNGIVVVYDMTGTGWGNYNPTLTNALVALLEVHVVQRCTFLPGAYAVLADPWLARVPGGTWFARFLLLLPCFGMCDILHVRTCVCCLSAQGTVFPARLVKSFALNCPRSVRAMYSFGTKVRARNSVGQGCHSHVS